MEALNPEYFLPDERRLADFLKYINRLATQIKYVDSQNKESGDWQPFFLSDETFLLAEISGYEVSQLDRKRIALIQTFESHIGIEAKAAAFAQTFALTYSIFSQINSWYKIAAKYSTTRAGTAVESELASAIEYHLQELLSHLLACDLGRVFTEIPIRLNFSYDEFLPIWQLEEVVPLDIYNRGIDEDTKLQNALKHILLLFRTAFQVLGRLVSRAPVLLEESLEKNDTHQPQVGLLLCFLNLYTYVQRDLNELTRRHLEFYFKNILGQEPRNPTGDQLYFVLELAAGFRDVFIPAGSLLRAGQTSSGAVRKYVVKKSQTFSPVRITALSAIFVSRNQLVDWFTRFRLVSGMYASSVADSQDGQGATLFDPVNGWPTLGEEQRFLLQEQRTMPDANIGFAIASPVFATAGGTRHFEVEFRMASDSIQHLTSLLLEVAAVRQMRAEDVFSDVFSNAFKLRLTGPDSWIEVPTYTVQAPADWVTGYWVLAFTLEASAPAVVSYSESIHRLGYGVFRPVLQVLLDGSGNIHPFAFLEHIQLLEIVLRVRVQNLRNSTIHNQFGPINTQTPFELLGPTPRRGAYFLIGQAELFNKRITHLEIAWEYLSFPFEKGGLREYFAAYNRQLTNDSFQLALSARNDFQFIPRHRIDRQTFPMFTSEPDGRVREQHRLDGIDLQRLGLWPQFNLEENQVAQFNPEKASGFLRLELVEPAIGFGFDIFPSLFIRAATENSRTALLGSDIKKMEVPNNPFSPSTHPLSIDYSAESSLVFDSRRAYENDASSGEALVHLHPFGIIPVFSAGRAQSSRLMPSYPDEGMLMIGLEGITPPQELHLLFEMKRLELKIFGQSPKINWFYLSGDSWKLFSTDQILEDGTLGLMVTGVISFRLPSDMDTRHSIMPTGKFWIRVSAEQHVHMVARTVRIHPNAGTAEYQFENRNDTGVDGYLEAGSVQDFLEPVPGVIQVRQPLPSTGFEPAESDMAFYLRTSERLRHKNRCITRWDYERMLLGQFTFLSQVKCITPFGNEEFVKKGTLVIAAMPKIQMGTSFVPPNLSPGDLQAMEGFLKRYGSPFVRVEIRNPAYEEIRIKCKIRFTNQNQGMGIQALKEDLLRFICPWFFSEDVSAALGGSIKKSDLYHFIQSRPNVAFVTGLSVIHIRVDDAGQFSMHDSAIQDGEDSDLIIGGTPWSVLIPGGNHDFELIDRDEYAPPQPSALADLRIGVNMVISGEEQAHPVQTTSVPQTRTAPPRPHRFTLKF